MAKKKIKKLLKGAAKIALPAAALAMMMRGGKDSNKFLASGAAGGARLPKGDAMARARRLMTQNNAMRNSMMNSPFGGMMVADDMANDEMFLNAMKKGGRVKKTKGFSKTKKKQANKMRKK